MICLTDWFYCQRLHSVEAGHQVTTLSLFCVWKF